MFKEFCDFAGGGPSQYVKTLQSSLAIGSVEVKI